MPTCSRARYRTPKLPLMAVFVVLYECVWEGVTVACTYINTVNSSLPAERCQLCSYWSISQRGRKKIKHASLSVRTSRGVPGAASAVIHHDSLYEIKQPFVAPNVNWSFSNPHDAPLSSAASGYERGLTPCCPTPAFEDSVDSLPSRCINDTQRTFRSLITVPPPQSLCLICCNGPRQRGSLCILLFYNVIIEGYDWHEGIITCYRVICFSVHQHDKTKWSGAEFFVFFFTRPFLKGRNWETHHRSGN